MKNPETAPIPPGSDQELKKAESETTPLAGRKRTFLRKLDRLARTLALAGTLFGIEASPLKAADQNDLRQAQTIEMQMKKLAEIKARQAKLRELYGKYFDGGAEDYEKQLGLEQKAAEDLGDKYKPQDIVNTPWGWAETEKTEKPEVTDFAFQDGVLDSKTIRLVLDETFPKGWVNNEVRSVRQVDEEPVDADKDMQISGNFQPVARCSVDFGQKADIIFYGPSRRLVNQRTGLSILGHEIAHANGWAEDDEMTLEERTALLEKITERLSSPDRMQFSYVEAIETKNPQLQNYQKAKEYYAMLAETYFENADSMHVKDFDIIDSRVRRTDPSFNWKAARQRRDLLIQQALVQDAYKR